jgi:RNA recognition motif-containing protein
VTKIYVRNLDAETTEQAVRSMFQSYGDVERIRLSAHRNPARSGSFAFIEMTDAAANRAIEGLHGTVHGKQSLHVIRARPARSVSKEAAD